MIPTTKAGRRLLGLDMGPESAYWVNLGTNEMSAAILAIEAEARAALDQEKLAAAMHAYIGTYTDHEGPVCRRCREESAGIARRYARLAIERSMNE